MSLFSRIPNEFYKLFTSKYTEYYTAFLVAIYNAMEQSYSVLGLTEKECRAVMNERIASAAILWDDETYDEDGVFLTRSNMASVCLKHFEEWGWLKQDYDETLNSHVVTFPEYSQMYVELFARLMDEGDSQERESVLAIYSHLYTYSVDTEKNNEILKSALNASKRLVRMLVNMQDGMRGYFDELSRQKKFKGIQDVLVKEINNSDSRKYAILTTTDSFYRYKEAVKELIVKNLDENEARRRKKERELTTLEPGTPAFVRCSRVIELCDEAADIMFRIERQADVIERRYNKLIEQKTVFARRAAARIRYIMLEGADGDDRTAAFVSLLNRSGRKENIIESLSGRIRLSRSYQLMSPGSLYHRKTTEKDVFEPQAVEQQKQAEEQMASFVLKPLYTHREIERFRRKNEKDGVFRVTEDTVRSMEDLEKLFFVWQEATETAGGNGEIVLGEEWENSAGFRYSGLEIRGGREEQRNKRQGDGAKA